MGIFRSLKNIATGEKSEKKIGKWWENYGKLKNDVIFSEPKC
jgi:hypothetical protein